MESLTSASRRIKLRMSARIILAVGYSIIAMLGRSFVVFALQWVEDERR